MLTFRTLKTSLNSLDTGISFNDRIDIVGLHKSIINRKHIDGFVNCMDKIYGISWKKIHALVNKTELSAILLTTSNLTIAIAPILFTETNALERALETGKYNPESKIHLSNMF